MCEAKNCLAFACVFCIANLKSVNIQFTSCPYFAQRGFTESAPFYGRTPRIIRGFAVQRGALCNTSRMGEHAADLNPHHSCTFFP
jgi:hypothetical protein